MRTAKWLIPLVLALSFPVFAEERDKGPFKTMSDEELDRLIELHHTQEEEFRLVLLPTSVTDRRGRVVQGLEPDQFRLYEDQVAQDIDYFASEASEPLSIAFLLDVSGSMRQLGKLEHAKAAIRSIVEALGPEDRVGLIGFADEQVVWITDFTQDRKRFLERLDVQHGFGQTALNDAVARAPQLVEDEADGRRAVVLITDGVDNASDLSMPAAIASARRVEMPIYTVGFLSVDRAALPKDYESTNLEVLERVAHETGGRMFAVSGPGDLKEAILTLENELRHQYLIGYYTSARDGEYHRISVTVKPSKYRVRTRKGFWTGDGG